MYPEGKVDFKEELEDGWKENDTKHINYCLKAIWQVAFHALGFSASFNVG